MSEMFIKMNATYASRNNASCGEDGMASRGYSVQCIGGCVVHNPTCRASSLLTCSTIYVI